MKYQITIEQKIVHHHNDGEKWTSTEYLKGETTNFEDVQCVMSLITNLFPNTTVTISGVSENNTIEEE